MPGEHQHRGILCPLINPLGQWNREPPKLNLNYLEPLLGAWLELFGAAIGSLWCLQMAQIELRLLFDWYKWLKWSSQWQFQWQLQMAQIALLDLSHSKMQLGATIGATIGSLIWAIGSSNWAICSWELNLSHLETPFETQFEWFKATISSIWAIWSPC